LKKHIIDSIKSISKLHKYNRVNIKILKEPKENVMATTTPIPSMADIGTPNLNPHTDTKDKDVVINTIHQGGPPSTQKVAEDKAKAESFSAALAKQIATRVNVLDTPPKPPATSAAPPLIPEPSTKRLSPTTQANLAKADQIEYNKSIAEHNYLAASKKKKNVRSRGVKKVISQSSQSHFRTSEPLSITHGDAWESSSTSGKKKISSKNNKISNLDNNNSDIMWKPGKKQIKPKNLVSNMTRILGQKDEGNITEISTSGNKKSPTSRKNFEKSNQHTLHTAEDQFQVQINTGKRQNKQVATFKSSMKGAAAHPDEADSWMLNGSRSGKKQNLEARKDLMTGATADVPAAKVQKLRIHLVKNSQRNASNLGVGMMVRETDGIHNAQQMKERERPQKKHIHKNQNDHLKGARLSIHEKNRNQGLRQVDGKPTNHSQFVAPGIADCEPRPVSQRKQLKSVGDRNDTISHLNGGSMSPKEGATAELRRQLTENKHGRNMLTTTQQKDIVRGVRKFGLGVTRSNSKNGVIGGNGNNERAPAGFSSSGRRTMSRGRGVGYERTPPTAGGNSQIVFG
jgi:hypothetical protein